MVLIAIGFLVPSDHWGLSPWRWVILSIVLATLVGTTIQLLVQSREDHERQASDAVRDAKQDAIIGHLTQVPPKTPELLPGDLPVSFDAGRYFRTSHQSAWTADIETRIKIAAAQNKTAFAPEDFYAKLISIGLIAYKHDITWAYIWKSQLLMLAEMVKQNGYLSLLAARKFYDQATKDYPANYANYSFEQWLGFVEAQGFFLRRPSDILEVTLACRDFLAYLAFHGRQFDQRKG